MKRKDPVSFQDVVTPIFQERKKEAHLTLTAIRNRWPEIVGPDLARKCHPARVQRGVLWITAPDASWAYQFQFMRSELMQCLEAVLGPSDIREVRFKAGELPAADGEPGEAEPAPQPAPHVAPDDPLAVAGAAIQDPAMRDLFVRSIAKQRQNRRRRLQEGTPTPPPEDAQP